MRDNYFRGGDGYLCVFSLGDRASFESIKELFDHICRVIDRDDPPVVLVGNKADLPEEKRQVGEQEALLLAGYFGRNCTYIETSAKEGEGAFEAFEALTRTILGDKAEVGRVASWTQEEPGGCCSCCRIC